MLADLLPQRGNRPIHGASGEADGDLAVVPDPGWDGIPGRALGQEHDLDGDVAALADQLLDQPRQLSHDRVVSLDLRRGALALVEEGVGLIDDHQDQRPGRGGAEVPGVGDPEDLSDGALAVDRQPVCLPQHVPYLLQVVLGVQPGPGDEPVVVGAAVVTMGRRYDQVLMDAVADEFTDSVLTDHIPPTEPEPSSPDQP
jgi:hypothetical protein